MKKIRAFFAHLFRSKSEAERAAELADQLEAELGLFREEPEEAAATLPPLPRRRKSAVPTAGELLPNRRARFKDGRKKQPVFGHVVGTSKGGFPLVRRRGELFTLVGELA